jgi:hypothetical protein
MSTRTGPSIIAAYKCAFKLLKAYGSKPLLHRLDNEAPRALHAYMSEANIDFQLAMSYGNHRNAAERAIQTFMNHFITGPSSTNTNFPLNLWANVLQQGLLTLNLRWCSRINPQLSPQSQVHGAFD